MPELIPSERPAGGKRPVTYHGFTHPSIGEDGWDAWFKPCWVYVIAPGNADTPVKIGMSQNVQQRIATFEAGNPYGLRAAHTFDAGCGVARQVERKLHAIFADRALGREWFSVTADEAAEPIQALCDLGRAAMEAFRNDIENEVVNLEAARQIVEQRSTFKRALAMAISRQQRTSSCPTLARHQAAPQTRSRSAPRR